MRFSIAIAFASLLISCGSAPQLPRDGRPNVILIITDDQGYGDLGVHGNDKIRTPHLDALAKQSVRLESFHVMPVCSPTRACLLTGRYNYRTGVVDTFIGRSLMHGDEVTIAEMLRDAGYRTGIFGKWHLGDNHPLRPLDQGFEEALVLRGGGIGQPSDPPGGDRYLNPTLVKNGGKLKTTGYVSDVITDAAIEFIAARRNVQFFTYLAFNAPHDPLEIADSYVEPYRKMGLPENTAKVYGMVSNIDENIGKLTAKLDQLGLAQNTIVIFMTDNGPQHDRFNAGMRARKGTVFEGGIRVPGYVRWPARLKAGHTVDRIAAHIDITPTLLDACGVATPKHLVDGRSLLPLMKGEKVDWPDRTLFFQWHRGDAPEMHRACAALGQRYKLVRLQPNSAPMLFDLSVDPAEKNDIAAANPEIVQRMTKEYEAWFKDVSSTRGFAPPRISLGSPRENPVFLTRQDWRGPKAGWTKESVGHWEVEFSRKGRYEIKTLFRPPGAEAVASISLGPRTLQARISPDAREHVFVWVDPEEGPLKLTGEIRSETQTYAPDYVEVTRQP